MTLGVGSWITRSDNGYYVKYRIKNNHASFPAGAQNHSTPRHPPSNLQQPSPLATREPREGSRSEASLAHAGHPAFAHPSARLHPAASGLLALRSVCDRRSPRRRSSQGSPLRSLTRPAMNRDIAQVPPGPRLGRTTSVLSEGSIGLGISGVTTGKHVVAAGGLEPPT